MVTGGGSFSSVAVEVRFVYLEDVIVIAIVVIAFH